MRNLFDLTGRTALITGGGGLLGEKHAEAILEAGGNVLLADYREDRVKEKAEKLSMLYGSDCVTGHYMDVTRPDTIHAVCSRAEKIDILINNAAKNPKVQKDSTGKWFGNVNFNRFETMPFDYWNQGLEVTVGGSFLVSQVVVNKMIENDKRYCETGGVILNIASDLGVIAPDQRIYKKSSDETFEEQDVKPIFYSAAKWALIGMTKYLSTYLAHKNIRVNSLSPGGVFNDHPQDFVTKISNLIPMNRMANVDEYKGAVIFACSDASSYMTGHNLIVDGGRTVW